LTLDFHVNKRLVGEVAIIPSKRMRNKIAGFITHLMKRIQRGPVRGISLKLQEEERERRLDFVPEVFFLTTIYYYFFSDHAHVPQRSAIEKDTILIDADTHAMLEAMDFKDLPGVSVIPAASRA
jgi:small subunit ribosomal protein S17e